MRFDQLFKKLNCSTQESKIFYHLLADPEGMSVVTISRKANLPRSTIYGLLEKLITKGLIKKGLTAEGSRFFTESKANILLLFDNKISELKKEKSNLNNLLKSFPKDLYYKPKFTIYEDKDAYVSAFRDILRTNPSQTYWFWPLSTMLKRIPSEIFEDFHQERIKRSIWLHALWPNEKTEEMKKHPLLFSSDEQTLLRKIKILPKNIQMETGYGIYGTKVAFFSTTKENYIIIIDSKELSSTIKSQFDYLWNVSKQYST
jgi:sugar-specific transcriptional regulator TrmB